MPILLEIKVENGVSQLLWLQRIRAAKHIKRGHGEHMQLKKSIERPMAWRRVDMENCSVVADVIQLHKLTFSREFLLYDLEVIWQSNE